MATQTTVKPDIIKNLAEFVARYAKSANLGFDPVTREPTIYADAKQTVKVKSIPWKREADTLTVLAQPSRFSASIVDVATARLKEIRDETAVRVLEGEKQLHDAEQAVLSAWHAYKAATDAVKPSLRRDIVAAEKRFQELQVALAPSGRILSKYSKPQYSSNATYIYVPPMPVESRGLESITTATAAAAGNAE
jgi:hypothetical protein